MGWILDEIGDRSKVLPYVYPSSSDFNKQFTDSDLRLVSGDEL